MKPYPSSTNPNNSCEPNSLIPNSAQSHKPEPLRENLIYQQSSSQYHNLPKLPPNQQQKQPPKPNFKALIQRNRSLLLGQGLIQLQDGEQSMGASDEPLNSNINQFEPFRIPPNFKACTRHRQATQFGSYCKFGNTNQRVIGLSGQEELSQQISAYLEGPAAIEVCPCCSQPQKNEFPSVVKASTSAIYRVNESLGYFFTYLKVMCALLFVVALSVGIYSYMQIIDHCESSGQDDCAWIYGIPISKFHTFFTNTLLGLNIAVLLIMYLTTAYLYWLNAKVQLQYTDQFQKPSLCAVLLSNIDHNKVTADALRGHLNEQSYAVNDIIYTHSVGKYVERLAKKSTLSAKLQMYKRLEASEQEKNKSKQKKLEKKINAINDQVVSDKNKLNLGQEQSMRTDKVIVVLESPQEKQRFENQYQPSFWQNIVRIFCTTCCQRQSSPLIIGGTPIYIERIGEPPEMVWENLEYKSSTRYLRAFMGNVITLLILAASYSIVILLTYYERQFQILGDIMFAVLFALMIQAVNFGLDLSVQQITGWERWYTLTRQANIILVKNVVAFFLNTTVLPFSLFLWDWGSPNEDDLIRNIFTLFLISNLISPWLSLCLQPKYLLHLIRMHRAKNQGKKCLLTQIKANELFEKIGFELNLRYSLIFQRVANSMFYGAVFPVGIILALLGLLVTYWSSKWWLLRYCSIPRYSFRLGKLVNDLTCFFPCVYAFGYAFNLYMLSGIDSQQNQIFSIYISFATLLITLIFLFFGHDLAVKVQKKRMQKPSIIKQKQTEPLIMLAGYRQLNPTSFLQQELREQSSQNDFQQLWNNLLSYVIDSEVSRLKRHSNNVFASILRSQYSKTNQSDRKFLPEYTNFEELSQVSSRSRQIPQHRNQTTVVEQIQPASIQKSRVSNPNP